MRIIVIFTGKSIYKRETVNNKNIGISDRVMIYFNNRNGSSGLTCRLISATAIYGRWNSSLCWKGRWYPTHGLSSYIKKIKLQKYKTWTYFWKAAFLSMYLFPKTTHSLNSMWDTGHRLEDLIRSLADRDGWSGTVKGIRANGISLWVWWWL